MIKSDLFIDYSALPNRLSNDMFVYYYNLMKKGDMSAREKLILHNIKLVGSIVYNKFANTPYDEKELMSVGIMGLIKSIDKFDISKNVKFSTFATKVISNEILMFMRKGKKHITNKSLNSPISTDNNGHNLLLQDIIIDSKINLIENYEDMETITEVMKFVNELPERNKEILKLYFGFYNNKQYSQQEIANIMGISQSAVSKMILKDIRKIKILYDNYQEKGNVKIRK